MIPHRPSLEELRKHPRWSEETYQSLPIWERDVYRDMIAKIKR